MTSVTAFAALSKQVALHGCLGIKLEWRADDAAAATGLFIQVHNSSITPASGAVPLKSYAFVGGGGSAAGQTGLKEYKWGDLQLPAGCFVGVSSTEATYTAATGSNKFAMLSFELSDLDRPTGTTFVGNFTSDVDTLQVWTEAAGATTNKRLLAVEVDGTNISSNGFVLILSSDTTSVAPVKALPINAGEVRTGSNKFSFGETGFPVNGDGKYGCTLILSSSAAAYSPLAVSGARYIKAEYKN